jgi:leader peptidase (prepilin peptidase) / N-methyltransferase
MTEEILLIAWFFVLGAVIGSFLNVVVYRLPNGMSLVVPPSHCPACNHRIRWFDNIPIVSWLVLGRRCRDCHASISARYPIVEGITAVMFALLTAAELTFKGINLPVREIYKIGNITITSGNDADVYGILLYHLLLMCTLFTAALIEIDRHDAPRRLFVPALVSGVIAALIWPYLRPVPAWPSLSGWLCRICDGTAGLAAGGLLGYIAWLVKGAKSPGGTAWGLLCVGVFLGWQAVFGIAFVIIIFAFVEKALRKCRKRTDLWPLSVWLYTVTLGWILAWSQIVDLARQGLGIGD